MNLFLYDLIDWIVSLFSLMDDIILFSSDEYFNADISLLDVSISCMIMFVIVQFLFSDVGVGDFEE